VTALKSPLIRPCLPVAVLIAGAIPALADSFRFNFTNLPPDVLVGFRQTGGAQELVADLGPASRFYQAAPGSRLVFNEFSEAQLTATFSGLDNLGIVACAAVRVTGDADRPLQTLWVTRRRADPATQSTPWNRQSSGGLANTATRISSIGSGTATYSSSTPEGPNNTATAVQLPATYSEGLSAYLGTGNFKATFQGNAENVTPVGFTDQASSIRSDFYEIRPGSGASLYLGYFEFTSAGELSFTAAGGSVSPAPAPHITGIAFEGGSAAVTFTTVAGPYQYQLLVPPAAGLGAPLASWLPTGNTAAGTGSPQTLTDATANSAEFYAVRVQP
jgi:hypothetical protein